ncbi:cation:proton antiporter [Companilactobacillus mishanensis]|uniref:Sodium:proton antiporter n=1 Tax=Companilactobacillus mishanensis TaxID=2486008 RepID=A0ABW9P870_9LACO|nr:sodium:proton antiporter [Companilactobacillus mishanensis]MQS45357.1 sodium:proton antiporter [Companilactobacillus mishanensis]
MQIVETIILIISLLIVANIISHYFVSIPASLIQIVAGVIAAMTLNVKIMVNTEWFLLVFIAPILFNDGNRFPKKELWKLKGPIMGNAIILVIVSTVVGGALVKWLVPSLPWATAFTLVAVLSPTDPIAVQSIAKKAKLPDKLMHLISGESLINDASGLICFKYAVAATVTGVFSLRSATLDFFYIAIVGALAGAVMIWIFNGVRLYLINQGVDDSILHAIIQILIPFIIYYIAEDLLHVSGVVAVVIAGILNISSSRTTGAFSPEIRLVSSRTWDMLVYLLNGFVFVLLGIEIPFAMEELIHNDNMNTFKALGFAFVIWVALVVIRFIWSYFYSTFFERSDRTNFNLFSGTRFYYSLMSGISGVRGAVTMVGVLSLPFVTNSGAAFPARTLLLFIASAVIIYSLLGATILIPLITKSSAPITYRGNSINTDEDLDIDDEADDTEVVSTKTELTPNEANKVVLEKTISKLRAENLDNRDMVYTTVIAEYVFNLHNLQLKSNGPDPISKKRIKGKKDAELWDVCFNCELEAVEELYDNKKISEDGYDTAVKKIEKYKKGLVKKRYNQTTEFFIAYFRRTIRELTRFIHLPFVKQEEVIQYNHEAVIASVAGAKRALEKLRELEENDGEMAYDNLLYVFQRHYEERLELLQGKRRNHSEKFNVERINLEVNALSYQRAYVQDLLEQGKISRVTANNLRKNINYSEEVINFDIQ